jgi:RNA recognition motif-containing protein
LYNWLQIGQGLSFPKTFDENLCDFFLWLFTFCAHKREFYMNLYIGNLAYGITSDDLKDIFTECGEVSKAVVINDRETGRSKGFGFVEYSNAEDGQKAIEMLNEYEVAGRPLRVSEAKPREEKPRGSYGGGGGGRGGNNRY